MHGMLIVPGILVLIFATVFTLAYLDTKRLERKLTKNFRDLKEVAPESVEKTLVWNEKRYPQFSWLWKKIRREL